MYRLRCTSLVLIVLPLFGCLTFVQQSANRPTEEQLASLDPRGVVETYWNAALAGDDETVTALVAPPNHSLSWGCPPKELAFVDQAAITNESIEGPSKDVPIKNYNYLELIQIRARVIQIARKKLNDDLVLTELKANDSEARLIYRRKSSKSSSPALAFFIRRDGDRWKLIDVRDEDQVFYVGNKKFGEVRQCPNR